VVVRATALRFAPATLVVDAAGDVRHLKGDLQGLVALPEGRPVMQLMALLRRELRPELARLIRLAREAAPAGSSGVSPKADSAQRLPGLILGRWRNNRAISADFAIRQSVQPITDASGSPLLLVCFERRPLAEMSGSAPNEGDDATGHGTSALEEELTATREHLYTVIEELETSLRQKNLWASFGSGSLPST
jgi:two-component system CheB/CheR fusion protein